MSRAEDRSDAPHVPVLLGLVMEFAAPVLTAHPDALVVDGTVGAGGHAYALLEAHPHITLLGLDRDPTAVELATRRLAPFGDRARVEHGSYAELARFVETRMLHWPESMWTYLPADRVLFTNDAYGMHMASDERWTARETSSKLIPYVRSAVSETSIEIS